MTISVPQSVPLYTAAQTRELDRLAIEQAGITGYALMTRAGEACWEMLLSCWPAARSVTVLCGAGNNGGDGYVIARLALAAGRQVRLLQLGDCERLPGEAQQARADFVAAGGTVVPFDPACALTGEVIIDALLGTGVDRPLEGLWCEAVVAMNAATAAVLAVDIPSGLHADSGAILGVAVEAQHTVTFIGRNTGLYTGAAADCVGQLHFSDLGIPESIYAGLTPAARLHGRPALGPLATPRRRSAHKGAYGHVLVIGGEQGMSGAVRLAGEAALRCGAGRVSVATRPAHAALITAACPELMCHGIDDATQLDELLATVTVVLIGPGLGRSDWAEALLATVLATTQPCVIDADALNCLAARPRPPRELQVLTPHPGEAARLLGQTSAHIQHDRFGAARAIQRQYGGTVVLKGAGTVTEAGEAGTAVCAAGNPGMATPGSGDVLSGVIAALIAQGLAPAAAAETGVCVHACAGDLAAAQGERGLLARDLIASLRTVMNRSESAHAV